MIPSDEPSFQQSIENYDYFHAEIKKELSDTNVYLKITRVIVIDEFLRRELISQEFHKTMIGKIIIADKKTQMKDLFYSMLFSGIIITYFMIYIISPGEYYLFRILCIFYISVIFYILVISYYRSF